MYVHACNDLPLPTGFNQTLFDAMTYLVRFPLDAPVCPIAHADASWRRPFSGGNAGVRVLVRGVRVEQQLHGQNRFGVAGALTLG